MGRGSEGINGKGIVIVTWDRIVIEDKKIVLENITSDIELETNDLYVCIKKK